MRRKVKVEAIESGVRITYSNGRVVEKLPGGNRITHPDGSFDVKPNFRRIVQETKYRGLTFLALGATTFAAAKGFEYLAEHVDVSKLGESPYEWVSNSYHFANNIIGMAKGYGSEIVSGLVGTFGLHRTSLDIDHEDLSIRGVKFGRGLFYHGFPKDD